MIHALIVAAYILTPDCQRLCLGVCHFDWNTNQCEDSRVKYIGTWNPLPLDYVPPAEDSFPIGYISNPQPWGVYPTEQSYPEE